MDRFLGGRSGGLYIVAGRPGSGKTAIALQIGRKVSGSGQPVRINSLEMTSAELSQRLLSDETGIDGHARSRGYLIADQWRSAAVAADSLAKLPMTIDDTGGLPIDRLMARSRRLKIEKGIELIIVDYLQLVRSSQKRGTREAEVADISRSLKSLAKELDVPVLCAAQLNREVEGRRNKTLVLADLRESGAIEQDADVIVFLCEAGVDGSTELIIGKNRQGPTGKVPLAFDRARTRFIQMTE